jgi:hypothetical protein
MLNCWSLCRVGREGNSSRGSTEGFQIPVKVHLLEPMKLSRIDLHPPLVIKVNQAVVECAMVRRGQSDAVPDVI